MRDDAYTYLVRVGLLCGIYAGTAMLGLSLDAVSGVATAVWPPTGIALAALILGGSRLWPGIALGAFLVNVWAGAPLVVAGGMAAGNTLEALLGTYLLYRWVGFSPALERLQDVGGLVIVAAALSTLASATVGVTSGWLGGLIPTAHYSQAWWTWWVGDMLGDLVVAPLVLLWSQRPPLGRWRGQTAELLAVLVALGGINLLVFGNLGGLSSTGASYLFFPFLIWTAIRYGPPGAALASAGVSTIAIWGTAQGWGPFVRETLRESLLLVQGFMGVATLTSLLLAAVVTERRRAEETRAHLAAIVASSDDAIIGKTLAGVITSWNAGAEQLYGYAADEVIGQPIALLIPPERPDELPAILARLRRGERIRYYETSRMRKDGQQLDVSLSISPIRDATDRVIGAASIGRDITERKRIEADLKAALQEKDLLLREIHHRVKNNLQVVSSLLGLQSHAIQDRRIRAYFEDSRDRIHAMALIHEHLYQSTTLAQIEMADYLQELATSVVRSYHLGQERIALEISAEAVSFDLETAIPCGLLLHELLSNCVKHAFPNGRHGTIGITLCRQSRHSYVLSVRDDGVGLPPEFEAHTAPSLGWQLVHLLAAQLHGTLMCESRDGTTVTCTFREHPSHGRG